MNFKNPIIAKSSLKNGNIQPIEKFHCYVHTVSKYTKRILSNVSLIVQTAKEQSGETKKKRKKKKSRKFSWPSCFQKRSIDQLEGTHELFVRVIARSRVQLGKICEYERGKRVLFQKRYELHLAYIFVLRFHIYFLSSCRNTEGCADSRHGRRGEWRARRRRR